MREIYGKYHTFGRSKHDSPTDEDIVDAIVNNRVEHLEFISFKYENMKRRHHIKKYLKYRTNKFKFMKFKPHDVAILELLVNDPDTTTSKKELADMIADIKTNTEIMSLDLKTYKRVLELEAKILFFIIMFGLGLLIGIKLS